MLIRGGRGAACAVSASPLPRRLSEPSRDGALPLEPELVPSPLELELAPPPLERTGSADVGAGAILLSLLLLGGLDERGIGSAKLAGEGRGTGAAGAAAGAGASAGRGDAGSLAMSREEDPRAAGLLRASREEDAEAAGLLLTSREEDAAAAEAGRLPLVF